MTKIQNSKIILFLLLTGLFCGAYAESIDPNSVLEERAKLEAELADLEAQMTGYEDVIKEKQREASTFERDITILDAQINKAKTGIRVRDLAINKLSTGIVERSGLIGEFQEKIEAEKISLSELLRQVNEMDSTSLVEILLGYDSLSEFFEDFSSSESVQRELQFSLEDMRGTQKRTEEEKLGMENEKFEQMELRYLQELEKKSIEVRETEKQKLLDVTKGEEAKYQTILEARQKDATKIRNQLFLLRGSDDIPFEKAVEYATFAWEKTGIRPAFLLGVIAEESNLGANVGTGNWKEDLSHENCGKQRTAFVEVTSELGLNPDILPVSRRAWYGYCGGAMGPAQFMPTTWQIFDNLIGKITGHKPPSPWNPLDAFVGAALLLKDNGAAEGGYTAERRAALRYLAGSRWNKPAYSFYGDDVMALSEKYQKQIDIISK
ncbi:lytic murein transglycosylase [Patescibacteria group bacterium]